MTHESFAKIHAVLGLGIRITETHHQIAVGKSITSNLLLKAVAIRFRIFNHCTGKTIGTKVITGQIGLVQ